MIDSKFVCCIAGPATFAISEFSSFLVLTQILNKFEGVEIFDIFKLSLGLLDF